VLSIRILGKHNPTGRDTAGLRLELVNALESLPADYLRMILLRDVAGLGIADIAARPGLAPAATKSRPHRARLLAREYLLG
jgi:DNA-directed RNA polymerase specialized sigma24 family protein